MLHYVKADPPSQAVLLAWKKVTANKDQLARFQDLDALKASIREADYGNPTRGKWFGLDNLLGTTQKGAIVAEKLLSGAYAQFKPRTPSRVNTGPGVNFDPATTKEGLSTW